MVCEPCTHLNEVCAPQRTNTPTTANTTIASTTTTQSSSTECVSPENPTPLNNILHSNIIRSSHDSPTYADIENDSFQRAMDFERFRIENTP